MTLRWQDEYDAQTCDSHPYRWHYPDQVLWVGGSDHPLSPPNSRAPLRITAYAMNDIPPAPPLCRLCRWQRLCRDGAAARVPKRPRIAAPTRGAGSAEAAHSEGDCQRYEHDAHAKHHDEHC